MCTGVLGISLEFQPRKKPACESDNEPLLRLVFSMDFFDKLKTSWSSPLRNPPTAEDKSLPAETWTLTLPTFTLNNIRLLLFRDCDRRGRKCLYDSHHVIRDKNGKFSYIPGNNGSEMKNLSEYIFGCVPLTSNCGTKRFHKYDGKYVWSQVFSPKQRNPTGSGNNGCPSVCKLKLPCSSSSSSSELSSSPNVSRHEDQVDNPCSPASAFMKNVANANSLPNIASRDSLNMGKCLSLPSRLVDSNQKTLLGLGIMLESSPENKETLGPYLLSISKSLEECSTWFSVIASQAYCSPNTFVQTLFDFSLEIKKVLYSRLVSPLVCTPSLAPSWKTLPSLTAELIHLILQYDEFHCKSSERLKIVLVGSSKRSAEVKGILYLFKLLLLKCNTETDVGIDATTICDGLASTKTLISPTQLSSVSTLPSSIDTCTPSSCGSSSMSMSSFSVSPPAALIQPVAFQVHQPKVEDEKLQKREYDSGIELEHDHSSNLSIMSMRRSVSQKFEGDSSGCGSGSSSDERGRRSRKGSLLPHQYSHEFEEVTFHLGDLGIDSDQSINTLALSEPNLDKLRIHQGGLSRIEAVDQNSRIEKLSLEPIQVKLDFGNDPSPVTAGTASEGTSSSHRNITSYCPYCDSIGIVEKFSPLYYIQWVRGASEVTEESFNLMRTFSTSKFIIVNLDKSYIRTVNFEAGDTTSTGTKNIPMTMSNTTTTSLVNNLLHNLNILSRECRESEIEQFLHIQLEFIKKIAYDFGKTWTSPTPSSCDEELVKKKYSYLNLSDNDFKLIYSLAKMKFPRLGHHDD